MRQLLGWYFDDLVVAPDVNRQPFAGVFFNDLLNGRFERHLSPHFERQFEEFCGWSNAIGHIEQSGRYASLPQLHEARHASQRQ